jgi:hypothetical protein
MGQTVLLIGKVGGRMENVEGEMEAGKGKGKKE